jgi:hypothetical protein
MGSEISLRKQQHKSPDGLLNLVVDSCVTVTKECPDGFEDWIVGIEPGQWHTHPDILANRYDTTQKEATEAYLEQIMNDKLLLRLYFVAGELQGVSVVDLVHSTLDKELAKEKRYISASEGLVYRYWSGDIVSELLPKTD